MKTFRILFLLAVLVPAVRAAGPEGFWKGAIELPGTSLAIEVEFVEEDKTWSGSISIPVQGLRDAPLADLEVEGAEVHFGLAGIPGDPAFKGEVKGKKIEGTFSQGGQEMPFALERVADRKPAAEKKAAPELPAEPIPGEGAAGEWFGILQAGPTKLRIAIHLAEEGGKLGGTMDSLDQGAIGMKIDRAAFAERTLEFEMKAIGGTYKGILNKDGSALEGTWTQGLPMELTLHRLKEAFSFERPQEPKPPFPYEAREVTFRNKAAGLTLAGTFLIPEGKGPFPAVLFVSGSGPQDRNEALMGHKPFLVIADHLARHGIASLRYDDRGFGESEGDHLGSTVADFATDAEAGLAFLAARKEVGEAIGIVGHSEGGLTGPIVATTNEVLDFLVLLAPPAERLDLLVQRQARDMRQLQGVDEELLERASKGQEKDFELLKDEALSREALIKEMRKRTEEWKKDFSEEELAALQYDEATFEQGLRMTTSPWFRSLMRVDPVDYLEKTKVPVLALLPAKDVQVVASVNAPLIKAALKKAGNKDFEVKILDGLNHLFQHCETGAIAEYATIEETFSPEALELISDWILKRYGK